jgi:hypothetical protein
MLRFPRVTDWLDRTHPAVFSAYAILAAFSTYFCMYAFRKPFAAGTFEGTVELPYVGALSYKTIFIVSQVLGYCTSKFLGIKVISEMTASKRAISILFVIFVAWSALLAFAVVPAPWGALCLFVNGLPLGMVWGLVFGFLEGRRLSEVLGAGLSASYILASGVVKSLGKTLMAAGVDEYWMPFVVGAIFTVPMAIFVTMLANLPPPSAEDIAARTKREPMDGPARKAFFGKYFVGLSALTMLYILLTAYRDFRDNFAVEIWAELGYEGSPEILAIAEIPVTLGTLVALALLMLVKDNRKALLMVHVLMASGTALVGLSTVAFHMGFIGAAPWMVCLGLGLYIAYVPYGCVLFDRLFAAVGAVGTAGFLIYVTDAFGYLGSVALMLYKDLGQAELSWLEFFTGFSYITAVACTGLFIVSLVYFARHARGPGSAPAP